MLPLRHLVVCVSFVCLGLIQFKSLAQDDDSRPNILFILIDDMGVEMSNAYGSEGMRTEEGLRPYRTPNMDAFAKQSMRFDSAFATPSCAPTRAQFLTGRYPFRTKVIWPTLPNGPLGENEITLANILRSEGYRTGMAGKWNLSFGGFANKATEEDAVRQLEHLRSHGFDESHTFVGHTIDYGSPNVESEYMPYVLNEWVLDFLDKSPAEPNPFYLQYSLGLIHTPWDPAPSDPEGGSKEENFLEMVSYADELIGRVLDRIDSLGIAENTLVIVAGDNGSEPQVVSRFRSQDVNGRKRQLFDFGSRVPFMVRWTGTIEEGSSFGGLMDYSDIFATLVEVGDGKIPADREIDGVSFLPQLSGETSNYRDFVFCQAQKGMCIRNDRYKWVFEDYRKIKAGLYDVSKGPFEETLLTEPYTPDQRKALDELQKAFRHLKLDTD